MAATETQRKELEARLESADAQSRELELNHANELRSQREALEQAKLDELSRIRTQVAEKEEALRKKLLEAERKLEQKTADELGKWPEADIEKSLRDAFPDDQVRRIGRGQPGADIVHTVRHKGQECGAIVIDSKNHLQWRDSFVDKLVQELESPDVVEIR